MATANQVSQLFVALYNRAIDGVTAQQYAGRAYNQNFISEVIGLVPNLRTMTNQEFVELVYKNALGKDNNSDKEGIDYWVSQANENNWRREQLTDNLLRSINAWADQNANTTGLTQEQITLASQGATVFRTKVAIAEQAATTVGGQADTYALTFGSGLEDVTILNYNTTRENNAKVLQGIAARNPLAQSGGNTVALQVDRALGQDSFLTAAPEESGVPSGAPAYATSTAFDDTITGIVAASGGAVDPTFTGDTQIDAGAGNDTLKLNMSTSFAGLSGDGRVTGVERIELTNTTVNDNVTFNASGIRDVYTYVLNGANGINLTNVAYNEYLLIEMNNVKSTGNTTGSSGASTATNGGVTQITFDTTPTGGRLDLNFNGVGYDSTDNRISNHDILFGIGSGTAIGPSDSADDFANQAAGIGILNIALTGNNYADIVNTGVNRITVGGNGSLTTNLSRGVTYFNGTNATGSLNITATDLKEEGENGTNIFEYFATGSAADKVHIAVERLGQNASVNLGLGNDTLTLSGQVDHEARKQFYNFNTIENLVFGKLTGDALLIDLGTTVVTTPQDPIIEGTGSKKTEIPQPDIVTTTQDRSANLQTITFNDGASVQLTSLGKKDLKVTYNGTQDDQKVLVDTEGTVNLVLQGSDTGKSGTGVKGGGFVNLSNAKAVNVDLTGQGFEGFLSAGNAIDLNIANYTGDKKLKLKANTATEKNDLSSVVNLTIDTEAQDINAASAATTAHSVDIENADLASIKNITLKGTGGVRLGELANKEGITIAGANYSGRLDTGNIYAGPGPLSITTKGAITTGNLTGNNITIDLSKNITTTEGQYNNNIGTIYVERVDATNSSGTLTYTTGISGTQGTPNADGTENDTQNIVVNTNSATLNINGAGGVDKFNIEASSFTKSLTIAGNLGTVPNYEEARNNYDNVRIDLSKTSGVNLDISRLLVSTPDGDGIQITASKGADNITLVAGANHDIIEFEAGGQGAAANPEIYVLDLGNLRLANNQSFSVDGLTITNISTDVYRATDIAAAIAQYATTGKLDASLQDKFSVTGDFASLKGDWAGATVAASGGALTFTSTLNRNIKDLNLSLGGNGNSDVPADITASVKTSHADVNASVASATFTFARVGAEGQEFVSAAGFAAQLYDYTTGIKIGNGDTNVTFTFSLPDSEGNTQSFTLTITADQAAGADVPITQAELMGILNSTTASGDLGTKNDGTNDLTITWAIANDDATNGKAFTEANFNALGITLGAGTTTATDIVITSDPASVKLPAGSTATIDLDGTSTDITIPAGNPAKLTTSPASYNTVSIKANGTKYEDVASLTVDGTTYKLQIINTTDDDFAFDADKLVKLMNVGSAATASTAPDYGKWNAGGPSWSGASTAIDISATSGIYYKIVSADGKTEDVGVSFGALLNKGLGIKAELDGTWPLINGIKFSTADATKWTASHDVKFTTTANFGNVNLAATITPNAPEPANVETSTFTIANGENSNTITVTGAGITGSALATQVYSLLTTGLIDSSFLEAGTDPDVKPATVVRINGATYSASNAENYVATFALPEGVTYANGSGTLKIEADSGASQTTLNKLAAGEITMSQTGQSANAATQTAKISAFDAATNGEISVTFGALKAGQSYTFNDKTVVATKDLSAGDVARAFTLTSDDSFDGAVILGGFDTNGKIVESEVLYGFSGADNSTLIIRGTTSQSITSNADTKVTGTGTIGVDTLGVSQYTAQQGSDGSAPNADSYVTFAVSNVGGSGAATQIAANTSALDTITNFDVANDGLRLKMGSGSYYGDEQALSGNVSTVISGGAIYVDANGNTLNASAANGIISFGAVNASGAAVDASITLEQKLYVATNNVAVNKVAGFAHEGDFYVIATGATNGSTTDDLVIRLAGVGGVTDITTLLA